MTHFPLARHGAVTLLSATTCLLLASCLGGEAAQDATGNSGGAPTVPGTGGLQGNSTGGSSLPSTGGQQGSTGGSADSTGGTNATPSTGGSASTTTGGSTTDTGGSSTGTEGGSGAGGASGTSGGSGMGGAASNCSDDPPSNGDTCAHAVEYGWCKEPWLGMSCLRSCDKCAGGSATGGSGNGNTGGKSGGNTGGSNGNTGGATTNTGGSATGGSSGNVTVPPVTNGTQGRTTRYWDCCKPSCGWAANAQQGGKSSPATSCGKDGSSMVNATTQSVCSGGGAYQCNWGVPWEASPTVAYGYAAFNGSNCGKCYQLDFTGSGDNPGAQSLKGKSMIVQAVNIGDIGANHFDLLIPGGGVGANNGCTGSNGQWGNVSGGAQSGGFLATCGNNMSCITDMCKTAFGSNASLMAGCSWFVGWFAAANNPGVNYKEVACPAEISSRSGLR